MRPVSASLGKLRRVAGVEAVAWVIAAPVRLDDLRGSATAESSWREIAASLLELAAAGTDEAFTLVSHASRRLLQLRAGGGRLVVIASPTAELGALLAAMKQVRHELAEDGVCPRGALGEAVAKVRQREPWPRAPHFGPTLRGLGETPRVRRGHTPT